MNIWHSSLFQINFHIYFGRKNWTVLIPSHQNSSYLLNLLKLFNRLHSMWICYILTADEGNIHISFHVKERQKKISGWACVTSLRQSATLQIKSPAMKKGFIPLTEAMETSREGWNPVFLDVVHVSPPKRSSCMFQLHFLKICSKWGWEKPWEGKKDFGLQKGKQFSKDKGQQ